MVAGHAHPKIVEAIERRARLGTHFAQPTKDLARGGGEPRRPVRAAAVAVLQLGHRVDARGRAPHARGDRARRAHEDRGHVPRTPRLADVLRDPRSRAHRAARAPRDAAAGARDPAGLRRPRPGRAVQRPRRGRARARGARGPRRRDVRRAGDDELRRDPARARLPPGTEGPAPPPRRVPRVRRGQDRRRARLRRRGRGVRRDAGRRLPRQGHRRGAAVRRDRRAPRSCSARSSATSTTWPAPSTGTRSRWRPLARA